MKYFSVITGFDYVSWSVAEKQRGDKVKKELKKLTKKVGGYRK